MAESTADLKAASMAVPLEPSLADQMVDSKAGSMELPWVDQMADC